MRNVTCCVDVFADQRFGPCDVNACLLNLRTLFTHTGGYLYDRIEMADYSLGYPRLMAHGHQVLPGCIMDVSNAELIDAPEAMAQRICSFCGLQYESSVIDIERNASAVSTASTEQVRSGIRRDHSAEWKPYQAEVAAMARVWRQSQPIAA